MLRIHQVRSADAAIAYFTQGLAREDYYFDGQEVPGRWLGKGAAHLGIDGGVRCLPVAARCGFALA